MKVGGLESFLARQRLAGGRVGGVSCQQKLVFREKKFALAVTWQRQHARGLECLVRTEAVNVRRGMTL